MKSSNNNIITIFSRRVCNELISRGIQPIIARPNIKNPGVLVWDFEDNEKIRGVLSTLSSNVKKRGDSR